jgi:hypothetical protein
VTTLRGAVYAVAAADTGAGGFVPMLADGASGLLGSDTSASPPAANALWAYLGFETEAESFAPNAVDGAFRYWLYDYAHMEYTRIDAAAGRLLRLYPDQTGALFRDTTTREVIWWQGPGIVGPPTHAPEYNQLLRTVTFPFRKWHTGV